MIILLTTFILPCDAEKIIIHTDSLVDLHALKNNNSTENLSVATNLYAFEHLYSSIKFEYMTTKRSLQYIDEGKSICLVNRIKTKQRLEKYIFSHPINLFLSRRLYQQASFPPLTTLSSSNNIINLSELFLEKPNARILLTEQISYGDALDEELEKIPDKNKMIRYSGEQDTGIINMFVKERAEFALLYPQQVYTLISDLKVRTYEIKGNPSYVLGHLMCTKTPENSNFIKQINHQLNSNIEKLLNIHLNFINPTDKAMFTHYFNQAF